MFKNNIQKLNLLKFENKFKLNLFKKLLGHNISIKKKNLYTTFFNSIQFLLLDNYRTVQIMFDKWNIDKTYLNICTYGLTSFNKYIAFYFFIYSQRNLFSFTIFFLTLMEYCLLS